MNSLHFILERSDPSDLVTLSFLHQSLRNIVEA